MDGIAQGPEWDAAFEDYRREQARSGECYLILSPTDVRVVPTLSQALDLNDGLGYRCWRRHPRYGVLAAAPDAPAAEDFERWFAEDIRVARIFGHGCRVSFAASS